MAVETYEDVLARAGRLEPEEQLRLLEGLASLVRRQVAPKRRRSIMEFEGVGQEIWRDPETGELIDAQEYVNKERDSWDG